MWQKSELFMFLIYGLWVSRVDLWSFITSGDQSGTSVDLSLQLLTRTLTQANYSFFSIKKITN